MGIAIAVRAIVGMGIGMRAIVDTAILGMGIAIAIVGTAKLGMGIARAIVGTAILGMGIAIGRPWSGRHSPTWRRPQATAAPPPSSSPPLG